MEPLVEWLKAGLMQPNKTQAGLARALGVDPAAVNRMMKGRRKLKAEEIVKASTYLGLQLPPGYAGVLTTPGFSLPANDHTDTKHVAPGRRDLPAYGTAGANEKGGAFFMNMGEPQAYVERPAMLDGVTNAYAVFVYGDSMLPALRQGWAVWVDPNRPIAPGDDVCIQTHEGESFLKNLKRRSGNSIVVEQYNPPKDIEFKKSEVKSMHLIVGSTRVRA